jgi:hypothetical protein
MKKDFIQDLLAALFTVFGCVYLFTITFLTIPLANQRSVDTITGFIMGTMLASILNYYWGSSKGSADKTQALANSTPVADSSVTISTTEKNVTDGSGNTQGS